MMGLVDQQLQLAAGQSLQMPPDGGPGKGFGSSAAAAHGGPGAALSVSTAASAAAGGMDPATAAVANLLKEGMSSPESLRAILQQLHEGAKDLEMTVAQLAVNLLQSASETTKGMQRQIPHDVLGKVAMMVVGKLLELAKGAQLIQGEIKPKQLAMRALALTVYIYENGKGSVR